LAARGASPTRSWLAAAALAVRRRAHARASDIAVQDKVAGLRRFGAAALDLAWVAAGRPDAYWERQPLALGHGAGIALVTRAGGFVTDLDGREDMLKTGGIIAATGRIHRELLQTLKAVRKA